MPGSRLEELVEKAAGAGIQINEHIAGPIPGRVPDSHGATGQDFVSRRVTGPDRTFGGVRDRGRTNSRSKTPQQHGTGDLKDRRA